MKRSTRWRPTLAAALACACGAAQAADDAPLGQARLRWDERTPATQGPLAQANALQPGIAPPPPSALMAELQLRGTLHGKLGGAPVSLAGDAQAWHLRPEGLPAQSEGRVNELFGSADLGAWQASAGKKIVAWDVGYAFRPNDVVQQELRRTLLDFTPEGRPVLQAEYFDADHAATLVWANPQHLNASLAEARGAQESALAARWYRRSGSADLYAFGRLGEHSRASLGAALAWVATDELELHGSWRAMQRHDGWHSSAGTALVSTNPWQIATLGGATQWLIGAHWTGALQQSLQVEYWHDGTTLSDEAWQVWGQRNAALLASPAPPQARAGNLAWQAAPWSNGLRRDNLFVRLAWQPDRWLLSIDALVTPADRGRTVTAAAQWQGDRWRIDAAWRVNGGPADSLIAQLPLRRTGLLALTWAF